MIAFFNSSLDIVAKSFKQLTSALKTWQKNQSSEAMRNIAVSILVLAGAMWVMAQVPEDRFHDIITTILAFGAGLVIAGKLLTPSTKKFSKAMESLKATALNAATLWGTAAALVGLGLAVKNILNGVSNLLAVFQNGNITDSVAGVTMAIATLVAAFWVFGQAMRSIITLEGKVISPKTLVSMAAALLAFGVAVRTLAGAVKMLAEMDDWENITVGTTAILFLMAGLAGIAIAMKKWGSFNFQNGAGFAALSAGVLALAGACMIISDIDTDALFYAFGVIAVFLAELALIGAKTKIGLRVGASFVAIAASVTLLVGAMAAISLVPTENLVKGFVAIEACLVSLFAVVGLLSGRNAASMAAGATAMLTISGAMLVLAGAVAVYARLGDSAGDALFKCGASVAGMAVAIWGLSKLKGDALNVAWVINTLSGGLIKLAAACVIFNLVNWQSLATAAVTISGLIAILMIAGRIESMCPLLAAGLKVLGESFDTFATGALKLAGAMAILGVLSMFAGPICQAIINAAPDIEQALVAVINMLCNVIVQCAEPLTNALKALIEVICNTLQAEVPVICETVRVILESVASTIWQIIKDLFAPFGSGDWWMEIFNEDRPIGALVRFIGKIGGAAIDKFKEVFGINSPSTVMAENGRYVLAGLQEGLQDKGALAKVKNAMHSVATAVANVFTGFWKIHSPSELSYGYGENINQGTANGLNDTKQTVVDAMGNVVDAAAGKLNSLTGKAKTAGENALTAFANGFKGTGSGTGKFDMGSKWLTTDAGKNLLAVKDTVLGGDMSWFEDLYKNPTETPTTPTPATGKKPKGGGTAKSTKTEADKLVDEYTKKLKANKAKMDAADKEYALWELTEGDTSSVEALVEKKTDSLTQAIADQTDRVAIAKEQYDKILAEKSSTDTQKSDAYATYLNEEKTLAELKGKKQATLFQVIKDRYDDEASTATDEYELWASLYEDTATVEEKSNKKIENLNKKIGIQAKVVTAAEEEYTTLKAEFGEESLKTQEAYRQWLEEQKEQQDLINEMNQAQLDAFDDALAMLEKQEKIITNRQNVLKKIYNDGDLSQREEAYKAAVKQYGADSKEARLASTQGTMTAILGVGTALDSMAYSVKKLTNKQNKYNEAVKQSGKDSEAALDALAEWQGEQYNFVGFAEDLATTFDLDDSGKRMTMQLGYAIARNWKPIQKGFQDVWQKVQTKFPQAAQNMANAFGLVVREGATEVITDVYSMITAAVGGDWGQALTSGIAAVLDFMGSDFGKTVLDTVGPMLATAGKKLSGTLAATLGGVVSEGGLLTTIGTKLAGLAATIGGEGGILATVGAKLAALAASLGPHGLLIAAVVAAGAVVITLLVKNWDKVKNFFGRALDWLRNLFSKFVEVGKNLVKGLWEGITGAAKAVGDGIKNLCTGLVNRVKSFFGIHSPSTVMAQLGEYMSLGFANGIADSGNAVDRSMNDVMRSALRAAQMSADMILSCFDEDADFRPTITPVVDLEGVRNSANWMQSAFADPDGTLNACFEQPTQLMRSFAKRREIQNGEPTAAAASGNDDVVAAIESLGSRVDAVSEAVRNMKLSIDRRKLVGEIIEDVDTKLMERAERRRR